MTFHTVCISFTQASEGEAIGRAVAKELGYRFIDEEIITKAAELAGVQPERIAATEQRQPLVERLLEKLSLAQSSVTPGLSFWESNRSSAPASSDDLRDMIRAAIGEVAREGRAVIVAHGASMALAGTPGVLRVLVTAPEETRIDRLAEQKMLTRVDASFEISESDDARRSYFRNFYNVTDEQPIHYDLVVNTEVLPVPLAAELVLRAAKG